MQYELVRTNRKTLALTVDRQGHLTVRAPLSLPTERIEAFLTEKRSWIDKTRDRLAQLPPAPAPMALEDGTELPYLGRALRLKRAAVGHVCLSGDTLLVPNVAINLAPVLRWVDAQARLELSARVNRLSRNLSLYPKTLRLTHAKGRWGSMSTRGTLSLNRALLHCPPDVVEYVIIHELCHIAHPNHSPAFWHKVETCLPDYRAHKNWLREHQSLITLLPD